MKLPKVPQKYIDYFKKGFITGLGWTIGATIGVTVLSTVVVALINAAGGLPLVGHWIADLVSATRDALNTAPGSQ